MFQQPATDCSSFLRSSSTTTTVHTYWCTAASRQQLTLITRDPESRACDHCCALGQPHCTVSACHDCFVPLQHGIMPWQGSSRLCFRDHK